MCVIIQLRPEQTFPEQMLFNAAANNWHSWGIVIKTGTKLVVHKSVPEGGTHTEIDKIKEILHKNVKYERIVHFRHNTRGETSAENTHPFLAYEDKKRSVYFMHNGTFTNYGNGANNPKSDTLEFVEQFLTPALSSFVSPTGFADYTDAFFSKHVLGRGFDNAGGSNRGIIMANNLPTVRLGSWMMINPMGNQCYLEDTAAFFVSTMEYFSEIKRGPFKDQMDAAAKAAAEQKRLEEQQKVASIGHNSRSGVVYSGRAVDSYNSTDFQPSTEVLDGLSAYMSGVDLLDDADLSDLGYCTIEEFDSLVLTMIEANNTKELSLFIEHLTARFNSLYQKNKHLEHRVEQLEAKKVG